MAHKCYPEKIEYINTVLEVTKKLFDNIGLTRYLFCLWRFSVFSRTLDLINQWKLVDKDPSLTFVFLDSCFFQSWIRYSSGERVGKTVENSHQQFQQHFDGASIDGFWPAFGTFRLRWPQSHGCVYRQRCFRNTNQFAYWRTGNTFFQKSKQYFFTYVVHGFLVL